MLLPTLRIAHVTDLHLDPKQPDRQTQALHTAQALKQHRPHVVVVTGDLTDYGYESEKDLIFGRDWLNQLGLPWRVVPGNHDIGNFADQAQGAIQSQNIQQWEHVFGSEVQAASEFGGWVEKLPVQTATTAAHQTSPAATHWTLVGLNSMLFGSDLPQERSQLRWLEATLTHAREHHDHIGVFLHSPLMVQDTNEPITPTLSYWLGDQHARKQIWQLLTQAHVTFIASGHTHQSHQQCIETQQTTNNAIPQPVTKPITLNWGTPTSGTWVQSTGLPNTPAPEKTGFDLYELHSKGFTQHHINSGPIVKTVAFEPWP